MTPFLILYIEHHHSEISAGGKSGDFTGGGGASQLVELELFIARSKKRFSRIFLKDIFVVASRCMMLHTSSWV